MQFVLDVEAPRSGVLFEGWQGGGTPFLTFTGPFEWASLQDFGVIRALIVGFSCTTLSDGDNSHVPGTSRLYVRFTPDEGGRWVCNRGFRHRLGD